MAVKKTTTASRKNAFTKEAESVVENTNTETVETVKAEEIPVATSKANTKKFVADKYGLIVSEDEADAVGIATWAVANIEEDK